MNTTPIVGMWGLLAAVEATIKAAPPAQRGELAAVLDAYARDFPEEFSWAMRMKDGTLPGFRRSPRGLCPETRGETWERGRSHEGRYDRIGSPPGR